MKEVYTVNMLDEVYKALSTNEDLLALVPKENIWKHRIPETEISVSPSIRIVQTEWKPFEYASNIQNSYYCEFQIDVWQSQEQGDPFLIGQIIQHIMKQINFEQTTAIFSDDEDTEFLRDGRRYNGIIYI